MKRFIAMLMIIVGAGVGVWGAYNLFRGGANLPIPFTNDFRVSPILVALTGLASFTLGIIGYRD